MSLSVRDIMDTERQKAWRRVDCLRGLVVDAVRDPAGFYRLVTQAVISPTKK